MFIPPPSPTPGWATGEVWRESTATLRRGMTKDPTVGLRNLRMDPGHGRRGRSPRSEELGGRRAGAAKPPRNTEPEGRGTRPRRAVGGAGERRQDLLLALGGGRGAEGSGHGVGGA